jgi:ATP-dependent 26S proteasome regulatory subunit
VVREAKENDAVLFFDEVDSLLSRRVGIGESCATPAQPVFSV